jgi:hypothetical protein
VNEDLWASRSRHWLRPVGDHRPRHAQLFLTLAALRSTQAISPVGSRPTGTAWMSLLGRQFLALAPAGPIRRFPIRLDGRGLPACARSVELRPAVRG